MNKLEVESPVGFADAEIRSYEKKGANLIVRVSTWDAQCLELEFESPVHIRDWDAGSIESLALVTEESGLLREVAQFHFEVVPKELPFRHYVFTGMSGEPTFEIVASELNISVVKRIGG